VRPYLVRVPLEEGPLAAGEAFAFEVTLLGGLAAFADIVVDAFLRASDCGLGDYRATFRLADVQCLDAEGRLLATEPHQDVLRGGVSDGAFILEAPSLVDPDDSLAPAPADTAEVRVRFLTPTALKYRGKVEALPSFPALVETLGRRVRDLFGHWGDGESETVRWPTGAERVRIVHSDGHWRKVIRESRHQGGTQHDLSGYEGVVTYRGPVGPYLPWLRLGELVHVGRNTNHGCGWMHLIDGDQDRFARAAWLDGRVLPPPALRAEGVGKPTRGSASPALADLPAKPPAEAPRTHVPDPVIAAAIDSLERPTHTPQPTHTEAPMTAHDDASTTPARQVVDVPLTDIDTFDETYRQRATLRNPALLRSLREHGQKVPVFLQRVPGKADLRIVAGFCRCTALNELGRKTVQAIVLEADDPEAARIAWAENAGRRSLNDEDLTYLLWRHEHDGMNLAEIAARYGMSKTHARRLRDIGAMPDAVRKQVSGAGLPFTHAAVLGAALRRWPRFNPASVIAAWQDKGWGSDRFGRELERAAGKRAKGRPATGLRLDARVVRVDRKTFDPSQLDAGKRRELAEFAKWLLEAIEG